MKKRVLSVIIAICVMVSIGCIGLTGTTVFASAEVSTYDYANIIVAPTVGDGTLGNPYQISTVENLKWMDNNIQHNAYYDLVNDIDFAQYNDGTEVVKQIVNFIPFNSTGYDQKLLIFDGQGFTISNVQAVGELDAGLFAKLKANSVLKNLNVVNIQVENNLKGNSNNLSASSAGALVGRLENATITNCSVTGGSVTGDANVGGAVGISVSSNISGVAIKDVAINASIANVGGLVGRMEAKISKTASLNNSFYIGNISAFAVDNSVVTNVGGMVGDIRNANIDINNVDQQVAAQNMLSISGNYVKGDINSSNTTGVYGLLGVAPTSNIDQTTSSIKNLYYDYSNMLSPYVGVAVNGELNGQYSNIEDYTNELEYKDLSRSEWIMNEVDGQNFFYDLRYRYNIETGFDITIISENSNRSGNKVNKVTMGNTSSFDYIVGSNITIKAYPADGYHAISYTINYKDSTIASLEIPFNIEGIDKEAVILTADIAGIDSIDVKFTKNNYALNLQVEGGAAVGTATFSDGTVNASFMQGSNIWINYNITNDYYILSEISLNYMDESGIPQTVLRNISNVSGTNYQLRIDEQIKNGTSIEVKFKFIPGPIIVDLQANSNLNVTIDVPNGQTLADVLIYNKQITLTAEIKEGYYCSGYTVIGMEDGKELSVGIDSPIMLDRNIRIVPIVKEIVAVYVSSVNGITEIYDYQGNKFTIEHNQSMVINLVFGEDLTLGRRTPNIHYTNKNMTAGAVEIGNFIVGRDAFSIQYIVQEYEITLEGVDGLKISNKINIDDSYQFDSRIENITAEFTLSGNYIITSIAYMLPNGNYETIENAINGNSAVFTLPRDRSYVIVVNYAETVIVNVRDDVNSIVEATIDGEAIGRTVEKGSIITVKVTPKQHYNYIIKVDSVLLPYNESNVYLVTVDAITTITVESSYKDYAVNYNITNGTITDNNDNGTIKYKSNLEFTIVPNNGYEIKSITINGVGKDSNNPSPREEVVGVMNIVVVCEAITELFDITIIRDELNYDKTSIIVEDGYSLSNIPDGSNRTISSTFKSGVKGYEFKKWIVDGVDFLDETLILSNISKDMNVELVVGLKEFGVDIINPTGATIKLIDNEGNEYTGKHTLQYGTRLSLHITIDAGYEFKAWLANGSAETWSSNGASFQLVKYMEIEADVREEITEEYDGIDLIITKSGAGGFAPPVLNADDTVMLVATSKTGSIFLGWYWNDELINDERKINDTTVIVANEKDARIEARFELITYNVTVKTNMDYAGRVISKLTYTHGEVTEAFVITASRGYAIVRCVVNGVKYTPSDSSETNIILPYMEKDINIVVTYEKVGMTTFELLIVLAVVLVVIVILIILIRKGRKKKIANIDKVRPELRPLDDME